MKKIVIFISLLCVALISLPTYANEDDIIMFDDLKLKEKLLEYESPVIDVNDDGEISMDEASKVEVLDLSYSGIHNINGIQHFTSVSELNLEGNYIVNIKPIDSMKKMARLNLNNNNISDISPIENIGPYFLTLFLNNNNISDFSLLDNIHVTYQDSIYGNPKEYIVGKVNPIVDCSEWAQLQVVLSQQYGITPIEKGKDYSEPITIEAGTELFKNMLEHLMTIEKKPDKKLWDSVYRANNSSVDKQNIMDKETLTSMIFSTLKILDYEYSNLNEESLPEKLLFETSEIALNTIIKSIEIETGHQIGVSEVTNEELISIANYIFESFLDYRVLSEHDYEHHSQKEIESKYYLSKNEIKIFLEEELFYSGNREIVIDTKIDEKFMKKDFLEAESNFIRKTGWYPDYTTVDINTTDTSSLELKMSSRNPLYGYGTNIGKGYISDQYDYDSNLDQRNQWAIYRGSKYEMLQFINRYMSSELTDTEKVKLIYDFLIDNMKYSSRTYGGAGSGETALFNGLAGVRGYANSFKVMCILSGIDCYIVEGGLELANGYEDLINSDNLEVKALSNSISRFSNNDVWNLVAINGEYYHFDLSMDDRLEEKYKYYMLSSDELAEMDSGREKGTWEIEALITIY